MPGLTVIVPTLNEAALVGDCLAALAPIRRRGHEVIVIDGGSTDSTVEAARRLSDSVLVAPRGRAAQMNAGARAARGEMLMFLHADTRLPAAADALVADVLASGRHAWGRFDVEITGAHALLPLVASMMNWRSRLTGIATGDQAMFMRTDAFLSVGGFPALELMEDVALSRALKRISPPACLRQRVTTSGRRWERHGVLRTVVLMWWLRLQFFLGANPARLARIYDGRKG